MGNCMSKRPKTKTIIMNFNPPNIQLTTELDSYRAARGLNHDVQTLDRSLQGITNDVFTSLATGPEVRAVSFDALGQVLECLLETNQGVVRVILECKEEIRETPELFELVDEYFKNSLQTLDFCTALEKCLRKARESQVLTLTAVQTFDVESGLEGNIYVKTLEELKKLKAAGDPFTNEFINIFQSVYTHQISMLEKLQIRQKKLDKKLKIYQAWRKVSGIIFATAVLISSVVAVAIAVPPVATVALAVSSAVPLGSVGTWIDSLWKKYKNAVKGEKGIVRSMELGTQVMIKDLDDIRVLIDHLEIQMESPLNNVDFVIEEEPVKVGIEEIKKKMGEFMKRVEVVGAQADMCSRDVTRARTVTLQTLVKPPIP